MKKGLILILALLISCCAMFAQKQSTKLYAINTKFKKEAISKKGTVATSKKDAPKTKVSKPTSKKVITIKEAPKTNIKKAVGTSKANKNITASKKTVNKQISKVNVKNYEKTAKTKKTDKVNKKVMHKAVVAKKKKAVTSIKEKVIAKTRKSITTKKENIVATKNVETKAAVNKVIIQPVKKEQIVKAPKIKTTPIPALYMSYPLQDMDSISFIKHHYGKVKINESSVYFNEGLTFETELDGKVYCNIDTAIVNDVTLDDDSVYTVLLTKNDYTIVLHNLSYVQVATGDTILLNQQIGNVGADEMQPETGILELMLFRKNKVLNPEKFIKRNAIKVNGEMRKVEKNNFGII